MNTDQVTSPIVRYRTAKSSGLKIFYREAGELNMPAVLLLHGFPTSSHMFRGLIPLLADRYRVIAADLPGFGFTEAPPRTQFKYTFGCCWRHRRFHAHHRLDRYARSMFSIRRTPGFRLALAHPERVTGIISQNGNAYEEGLGDAWNPIQKYWKEPTRPTATRSAPSWALMEQSSSMSTARPTRVQPEAYWLDTVLLQRPGNTEIQLDLFLDYANNIKLYPAFQDYFRKHQPPFLATWGQNDPFFYPAGRKGVPARHTQGQGRLLRHGTLRAGDACPRDRNRDSRVPGPASW